MVSMYCVKCRKKVNVTNATLVKKGKRKMLTSKCPKCGTKMFRFTK